MASLEKARKTINEVDAQIAELFCRRMEAVREVAEYKREHGLPVLDAQREADLLRRNTQMIENPELQSYYVNFQSEVMAVSRSFQSKLIEGMKIAYSGVEGAFAHIAAGKIIPEAARIAYHDFESAYRAVETGECDAAVLPIENSYAGEVGQVTDLLFQGSLFLNGIYDYSITQDLIGIAGASVSDIKTVVSHPQALAQCDKYIQMHGFETKSFVNTAAAAKEVADRADSSIAAIASEDAAAIYGLTLIEKNINESSNNTTRFALLSRSENKPAGKPMGLNSVFVFTVRNEAGFLAKALDVIGSHGFNLRTIRSRPMKDLLWNYYFYAEAEGNIYTDNGKEMLAELANYCDRLKIVGSYIAKTVK